MKKFKIIKLKEPYQGYSEYFNYKLMYKKSIFKKWKELNHTKTTDDAIHIIKEMIPSKKIVNVEYTESKPDVT